MDVPPPGRGDVSVELVDGEVVQAVLRKQHDGDVLTCSPDDLLRLEGERPGSDRDVTRVRGDGTRSLVAASALLWRAALGRRGGGLVPVVAAGRGQAKASAKGDDCHEPAANHPCRGSDGGHGARIDYLHEPDVSRS